MKTQLKKEQIETEIEILENKAKLKRQELKNSIVSPTRTSSTRGTAASVTTTTTTVGNRNLEYDFIPNRLTSAEALRQSSLKSPVNNQSIKAGINYEDVFIICFTIFLENFLIFTGTGYLG